MRAFATTLGIAVLATTAEAAPLAQLAEDVDGDGTPDALALDADGVLHVGAQDVKLGTAIAQGSIAVAHYQGKPLIVVELTGTGGKEAIVLERATTWRELLRFPIGGVGLDADYGEAVDATSSGVVRYQTRSDASRCDGKPAYLFPELLDVAAKRFRPVKSQPIDAAAPAIQARVEAGPVAAPMVYKAHLASSQPGVTNAGGLTIPVELDDGRPETAWRSSAPSDGRGQFFTFGARVASAHAKQIRIVPGDPASAATMKASGRPRELGVATAQGVWRIELPDAATEPLGTAFVAELPVAITGCVTIVVDSLYGAAPTAIAELEVYAEGERADGGAAMLARVVAEGSAGATTAAAALARQGAAGAAAIDVELGKTTDAMTRRRLIHALLPIADPAAAPALARAATEGWVRDHDLVDVVVALGALGQVQELHDLAATGGVELAARVAAAASLHVDQGFAALGDLAGKGPREVRHAVIESLAAATVAQLAPAAQQATTAAGAGDLWRAVTRHVVRGAGRERDEAIAAMGPALLVANDYERRYRLVDGIATLGDPAALHALDLALRALPAGAETSALRQIAIKAIASAPRADATTLVIAFAVDADPGVRLAALGALASADADASGPWHTAGGPDGIDRVIVTALSKDRWPEVRRRAADALGSRCDRADPAKALGAAVAGDADLTVRLDALSALVQCRAAGTGDLLARTWDDGKAPLELRAHAIDLAVALGDARLAGKLVERFAAWRGAALESTEALALAQNAAAAIGRLAPPRAADALLDALDDAAFPEIVTAAALGLGALGPACPAAAKTKLKLMARSEENDVVVAARRAAAQCGR